MAQRTQVIYTDDLDGSEAAGTVRFGLDGKDFEIDLSTANSDKLAKALEPFIAAARKVSARTNVRHAALPARKRHDLSAVRTWAREQGLKVSERGRIPSEVIAKYEAAH